MGVVTRVCQEGWKKLREPKKSAIRQFIQLMTCSLHRNISEISNFFSFQKSLTFGSRFLGELKSRKTVFFNCEKYLN